MYQKKFNEIADEVKKILKESPRCHAWEHTVRVICNAKKLAELEKDVNIKVIELGALLHDIARADEMAIKGKICHAKRGAKLADEILKKYDINEKMRKQIVRCVRTHRYNDNKTPESIEEKIIFDADKLDSIGAIGIGRAFMFAGHLGAKLHNSKEDAINSPSYSENDTAYREFLVKQRFIPKKMFTRAGRAMAEEKVEFMKLFFKQMDREIGNIEFKEL